MNKHTKLSYVVFINSCCRMPKTLNSLMIRSNVSGFLKHGSGLRKLFQQA